MTVWTLLRRSLAYYWRTHMTVALGVAVCSAILSGALLIGDSIRTTLRSLALLRIGRVELALSPGDRFFRTQLAEDLQQGLHVPTAPVIRLHSVAATPDSAARASGVQLLGVDARFWSLAPRTLDVAEPPLSSNAVLPGQVALSARLAAHLGVRAGDPVVLRVERPSDLPRDIPLALTSEAYAAFRLTVSSIVSDADFGRFNLEASAAPPFNAFVPIDWLCEQLGLPGRANLLVVGSGSNGAPTEAQAGTELRKHWQLADAGLELRIVPQAGGAYEIRSRRVFLEPPVARAAAAAMPQPLGIFTYFVNEIRIGDRATPYSMVSAAGPLNAATAGNGTPRIVRHDGPAPESGSDDGVVINQWLADDLGAKPGDALQMKYYVPGEGHRLIEQTNRFVVSRVVPIEGAAADPDLMPSFPGMDSAGTCGDWKSGVPIDLSAIRPKDEDYWKQYRGTPKAFISLATAQHLWGNRFGDLTAIRIPAALEPPPLIAQRLEREMDPAALGFVFQAVREPAFRSSAEAVDFGPLFIGFSLFLVVAALLLTTLLFVFSVEQRSAEVGTLLAVGIPPARVRRLILAEGALLALLGGVAGGLAGPLYARALLHAFVRMWPGALGMPPIAVSAAGPGWMLAAASGVALALIAMWITLRRQQDRAPRELLAEGSAWSGGTYEYGASSFWIAGAAAAGALLIIVATFGTGRGKAGGFFGAGGLLLAAGMSAARGLLARQSRRGDAAIRTLGALGLRNTARRPGRSLATIALLACGAFLVTAIGANRQNALAGAGERHSGTGGFRLVGETTLPILDDVTRPDVQGKLGLDPALLAGVSFVPMRLREGDDASCLNLDRAQTPRVLGVDPRAFAERDAFNFTRTLDRAARGQPWLLLNGSDDTNAIPAIGDETTIVWGLHKSVGDVVKCRSDDGREASLQIVGIIDNSILQGQLLISEASFTRLFPSVSGHRVVLVDAPADRGDALRGALNRALADLGLDLTPAAERLATFAEVENTYLAMFQVLGGFGLLLGTIGLGLVVSRNALERRSEFALLRAVGFPRSRIRRLVFAEHALLLALGVGIGTISALVAAGPALTAPGAHAPVRTLVWTLLGLAASGVVWIWIAIRLALRGPLLEALRSE